MANFVLYHYPIYNISPDSAASILLTKRGPYMYNEIGYVMYHISKNLETIAKHREITLDIV